MQKVLKYTIYRINVKNANELSTQQMSEGISKVKTLELEHHGVIYRKWEI